MPELIAVAAMRGNSGFLRRQEHIFGRTCRLPVGKHMLGFLRRQEPMSPAKERLQDGSLPAPGSGKRAGQFGVPA